MYKNAYFILTNNYQLSIFTHNFSYPLDISLELVHSLAVKHSEVVSHFEIPKDKVTIMYFKVLTYIQIFYIMFYIFNLSQLNILLHSSKISSKCNSHTVSIYLRYLQI